LTAGVRFHASVAELRREALLDAAQRQIERAGWTSVTMAKIADEVGVSRQTVYNELGTKHGLAEALALRELARFMQVVRDRMAEHDELLDGIHAACLGVLELAERSLLVRTIAGSLPGEQDADFLQLLTTESGEIVAGASLAAKAAIVECYPPLPLTEQELDIAVDAIVRLILSAITRPAKPPHAVADDITWLVSLVLAGAAARTPTIG
jgi:AcrR family transcriptional regulator